jgi:hypothetical protein
MIMKPVSQFSTLVYKGLVCVACLSGTPLFAGAFNSPFTGENTTLSGNAQILNGALQLNGANQGVCGVATLSDLDPGSAVQGFNLSAMFTTANGGGNSPADGFGIYFAAPGVVPVSGYQNYESLGAGSGIAILFDEFNKTLSIETGSTMFSQTLPNASILVGACSIDFSYDPVNGAVLNLTGSDDHLYTVSASAASLVSDGLDLQSGDSFTLGGRVGYPGATSADSHTINTLIINTDPVPEPSATAFLIMGLVLVFPRFRASPVC